MSLMILLVLAAAAMCPTYDTVCLDAEVQRLEREVAQQRRRTNFLIRMESLCAPPSDNIGFMPSAGKERDLRMAKRRACLARHRKEYEAMGMEP